MNRSLFLIIAVFVLISACMDPYSPTGEKDPAAPRVAAVTPADGAVDVTIDTPVVVSFTVAVDPATVTPHSLRLQDADGVAVPGVAVLSDDGLAATLTPDPALVEGRTYTVEVTRQIQEGSGIPLDIDGADTLLISTFTVLAVPPTIVSVTPADEATVSPDLAEITVLFSEPMDPATITPATLLLSHMQGAVSYDAETRTARFAIDGALSPLRTYTIFVAGTVTDEAGIPLGNDLIVRFTTTQE